MMRHMFAIVQRDVRFERETAPWEYDEFDEHP